MNRSNERLWKLIGKARELFLVLLPGCGTNVRVRPSRSINQNLRAANQKVCGLVEDEEKI